MLTASCKYEQRNPPSQGTLSPFDTLRIPDVPVKPFTGWWVETNCCLVKAQLPRKHRGLGRSPCTASLWHQGTAVAKVEKKGVQYETNTRLMPNKWSWLILKQARNNSSKLVGRHYERTWLADGRWFSIVWDICCFRAWILVTFLHDYTLYYSIYTIK